MNDQYNKAYEYADAMLANTADRLLRELTARLGDKDRGTLRDRIADAYVSALIAAKTN